MASALSGWRLFCLFALMSYQEPGFLNSGDKISIVAPSGKLMPGTLKAAENALSGHGYRIELGAHIFNSTGYFSAPDEQRLADLQKAVDDQNSRAILCARGGYGTTRIIDQLDLKGLADNPKWIVGYSDITALHLKLSRYNIQSIHGPMGTSFNRTGAEDSTEALLGLLRGEVPILKTQANVLNRQGNGAGVLIGGNLALVVDSLGTRDEIDTAGKILFLEDIGEPDYKIDRMFTQLLRSGKLDELAGLVLGDFSENGSRDWQNIVLERVHKMSYPVAFDFPIGHEPHNLPVIVGATYNLDVSGSQAILKHKE